MITNLANLAKNLTSQLGGTPLKAQEAILVSKIKQTENAIKKLEGERTQRAVKSTDTPNNLEEIRKLTIEIETLKDGYKNR